MYGISFSLWWSMILGVNYCYSFSLFKLLYIVVGKNVNFLMSVELVSHCVVTLNIILLYSIDTRRYISAVVIFDDGTVNVSDGLCSECVDVHLRKYNN